MPDLQLELLNDAPNSAGSSEYGAHGWPTNERDSVGSTAAVLRVHAGDSAPYYRVNTPSEYRQRNIQIHVMDRRFKEPSWMHPNIGGEAKHLGGPFPEELDEIQATRKRDKALLTEWPATAISGNDIISSVLFTAGLTASSAGKYSPIVAMLVAWVVYCFRFVLEEVMSVIPLNGGCYNAILNSASKKAAAVSATFSILSYLATGVVCAVSAFSYLNTLVELPMVQSVVAMLGAFALLCLIGIAESSIVALVFFLFHWLVLTVLTITSVVYWVHHPHIFMDNMTNSSIPNVSIADQVVQGSVMTAVFVGFGIGMLGVTGIEASAQFVEQQASGVFPKTLRNMWLVSTVYNILFAFLSLAVVPLHELIAKQDTLLAYMGQLTAGRWFEVTICIDAFVVLAGAVLTSYVGIVGLIERLAIDRIFPSVLVQRNSCRNTTHWIIFAFFVLSSSLVAILRAKTGSLAGVYAFAFLGVLGSFAVACILLKIKRPHMPRDTKTSWPNVLFCLVMVILGFIANVLNNLNAFLWFTAYFAVVGIVMWFMLNRTTILKALLFVTKQFSRAIGSASAMTPSTSNSPLTSRGERFVGSVVLAKTIENIKRIPVVFFCKQPNLVVINQVIKYVYANEQTYNLRLIYVASCEDAIPHEFAEIVCLFDHIYPSLKVNFVSISGQFDLPMVEWISNSMKIPTTMMFMRQPTTKDLHEIVTLGVRVIAN